VDNHERKRSEQAGRFLAEALIMIMKILVNLDEIRLARRTGDGMREEISGDLMMVAQDILPSVEAPRELLSVVRAALIDWVIMSDLITLSQAAGVTPRRLDTIEEMAERLAAMMGTVEAMDPDLFNDRPDLFGDRE
jgi:hypothetical protein